MAYKFIRTAARLAVSAAMFLTLTNIPSTAAHVAHGSVTFVDTCIYNVTLDNPNSIVTIPEDYEGIRRITGFSVKSSCDGKLMLLGSLPTGQPGIFNFDNDYSASYGVVMRDADWTWDSHRNLFVLYNSQANRTYRGDIMTTTSRYIPKTYHYTIEVKTFAEAVGSQEDFMDDEPSEEQTQHFPKK